MKPHFLGLSSYYLTMCLSTVLGIVAAAWATRRETVPTRSAVLAACWFALFIVGGAALQFQVERHFGLIDVPELLQIDSLGSYARTGFRLPGGLAVLCIGAPIVCRAYDLSGTRFMDLVFPAVAVALGAMRIGCFFHGCCFGSVTDVPWAVRFPRGSFVYDWQMADGAIAWPAVTTLPVHPLQLYFVLAGLSVALLTVWLNRVRSFEGWVWVTGIAVFSWAMLCLETLRGFPLVLDRLVYVCIATLTTSRVLLGMRIVRTS